VFTWEVLDRLWRMGKDGGKGRAYGHVVGELGEGDV
jgi:hypothetical protein